MIVCVRIPAFAAEVERRENAKLDGLPFVLLEVEKAAHMVYAASAEAMAEGVRIGMTLRQAQTLCPELFTLSANPARYHRAASEVGDVLADFTPLVEPEVTPPRIVRGRRRPQPSIGGDEGAAVWFMNPGRLRRDQGLDFAQQLHSTLFEQTGLAAVVGLAANRFTARIAAGSLDPRQTTLVARGHERDFLAPYPATLLPIYPEQARQLYLLGIRTLGDLAKLPASALGDLFGGQGKTYKRLAEGRDSTPVREYVPRRVEWAAQRFDAPVEDRAVIQNVIAALVEGLVTRLETRGQMAGELALTIALSGGQNHIEEVALRHPSASAPHLTRALEELLDTMRLASGVMEVEVTLGGIVEAEARQLSLFPPESVTQDRLRAVLRQLVARHGAETFYWADLTNPDARLPEQSFQLRQAQAA